MDTAAPHSANPPARVSNQRGITMRVLVIYISATGNTKRIANAIFQAVPCAEKDIREVSDVQTEDLTKADLVFVGFWVKNGSVSMAILDLLDSLHGKDIAIFGTCGLPVTDSYRREIESSVTVWIPDDCRYRGIFLCRGRMNIQVRERWASMRSTAGDAATDQMLQSFDDALLHPDDKDLAGAAAFARQCAAQRQSA